jgi:phage-related protein
VIDVSAAERSSAGNGHACFRDSGSAGVLEIVEDGRGGTYRAVYTVKFKEAVFVLHVFQKKSRHGMATPKPDTDIIRERLKVAQEAGRRMGLPQHQGVGSVPR